MNDQSIKIGGNYQVPVEEMKKWCNENNHPYIEEKDKFTILKQTQEVENE